MPDTARRSRPPRPSWRTPPFPLLAACCRWPADPAAIAAALPAPGDAQGWSGFVALAGRHRVEGLVSATLAIAGVRPPAPVAAALRAAAIDIARRGLTMAALSVRLQGALDAAGLPNLVLKGATLDRLAYGRLGLKQAWDIDLLTTREAAVAAARVLAAADCVLVDPPGLTLEDLPAWAAMAKECVFVHAPSGTPVELHWTLVDTVGLLPGVTAASPARTVAIGDIGALRTLGPEALFAYLCAHGTAHGWSRLKWLADLSAWLSGMDAAEVARLETSAQTLEAGVGPAVALRLRARLLGGPPRAGPGAGLEQLALWAMAGGGAREIAARPFVGDALLASHLLFPRRWRDRAGEFARQWTSLHDRRALALPGALGAAYHLIRIPSWLWRRAVRGYSRDRAE